LTGAAASEMKEPEQERWRPERMQREWPPPHAVKIAAPTERADVQNDPDESEPEVPKELELEAKGELDEEGPYSEHAPASAVPRGPLFDGEGHLVHGADIDVEAWLARVSPAVDRAIEMHAQKVTSAPSEPKIPEPMDVDPVDAAAAKPPPEPATPPPPAPKTRRKRAGPPP
jgi:hypothetical protein